MLHLPGHKLPWLPTIKIMPDHGELFISSGLHIRLVFAVEFNIANKNNANLDY